MAKQRRAGAPPPTEEASSPVATASEEPSESPEDSGGEDELADEQPPADAGAEQPLEGDPEDPALPPREVSDDELVRELAALLLASPEPLSAGRLRRLLGVPPQRVDAALGALSGRIIQSGFPWELRAIAGGWQIYTTPDLADVVARLAKSGAREERISPAALETLAVVAYRQPVTKAEIEAIRGVQVGPVLRALVDRGLLRVAGRADVPGSPLLYETTKKFLDAFGLMQIGDLPRDGELLKD
jgi:segregation and condensation protein B